MKARQMIIDALPRSEDRKRLLAAFDIAWKTIAPRAGDPAAVSENLARWLVSVGNGHPKLSSAELAKRVMRMFHAPSDRES
jgi:hypothetical protein